MDNQEALNLLNEFADAASDAVKAAVWAGAFLQEGGTPTWDATKSVSTHAETLATLALQVAKLRDQFDDIAP